MVNNSNSPISRSDSTHFNLDICQTFFGGGETARVRSEIREEEHWILTTVDYMWPQVDFVANRPAEADIEITDCLPPMPRGGNLLTSRIGLTPWNAFLESNSVIWQQCDQIHFIGICAISAHVTEWTATVLNSILRIKIILVLWFILSINLL